MLWIEKYRPASLDEMVGQESARRHIRSFAIRGAVPHLLVTGPPGTGKSVAIESLARLLYGEDHTANMTVLNAPVLFMMGKQYLEKEPRFAHIYRRDASLLSNIKRIVNWYASLQPLDAPFRMLVFDEAEVITRDLQQAMRRIMERFSTTCRFVFVTRHVSALIPAITSRCYPLVFTPLERDEVRDHLMMIMNHEGLSLDDDDIDLIVESSRGDLRRAVMLLQLSASEGGMPDPALLEESETEALAADCVRFLRKCDHAEAVKTIESMMIEYGLSGRDVARELRKVIMREYPHPRLVSLLAEADHRLGHSSNDFIQIGAFAAEAIAEVFAPEDQ
ncbi:MAG: AAA family ATPase [Methanoculleaceae archaeon]